MLQFTTASLLAQSLILKANFFAQEQTHGAQRAELMTAPFVV
jgi:hypothetical protein